MPRYEVLHTYIRTDVYYVEAEDQQEAFDLVRAGEVDCADKQDYTPESTKVYSIDDQGQRIDLLLEQHDPGAVFVDTVEKFLREEQFDLDKDQRNYAATMIAKLVVD